MIDININAIISQALAAAVQQAIQPLQQEYANKMAEMAQQIAALETRLLALENNPAQGADTTLEETLQRLDDQEWFWDKLRRFTDGAVESAIEQHCEEYDHDDMVMKHEIPDMDDYIKREDFDSEVRDAVRDTLEDARIHLRF